MAMTMACALLHPTWSSLVAAQSPLTFFGIPVVLVDYASSVIPIILSVWIMSYVEKFAEKYSPSIIKFFLKPLFSYVYLCTNRINHCWSIRKPIK